MSNPQTYVDVMTSWRMIAENRHLSIPQMALLAAELAGISVGNCDLSVDGQAKMLGVLTGAMTTACAGRQSIRSGFGRPVVADSEEAPA